MPSKSPSRRLRALIVVLSGLLCLTTSAIAQAQTPLPTRDDRSVHDLASVIEPAQEQKLEQLHRELFARAHVAIVLITVPRLVDETIGDLAVRVGTTWGVGRKGEDRGLVVAFSRDDREIFVATGYGTEEYLPDGKVGALIDQYALPHLKANRFSEGLFQLSAALASESARFYEVELTGAPALAPPRDQRRGLGGGQLILLLLAVVGFGYLAVRHPTLFLMMLLSSRGGRGRGGGGGFGGSGGFGGFGGGGFGGGGAGRSF